MQNPYLEKYLASYSTMFDALTGISSLLFVASIFLLARIFGVIKDENAPNLEGKFLILTSLIFCCMTFLLVFFAEGRIGIFFEKMAGGKIVCKGSTYDSSKEFEFFRDCIRPQLAWIVTLATLSMFASVIAFFWWLTNQLKKV